ncbi:MAG: hypothetical protein E7183_00255 [Erysipelotrichaceae bacterium]|nr:hypothetical protein [Erysipelotrichaceae bacterium]
MKFGKKFLFVVIAALVLVVASCGNNENKPDEPKEPDTYTYKSWTTALGSNWNPHAWETNADDAILSYISSPFMTMSIKDSKEGVYQWVYEMATEVVDTTKENYKDLEKYGSQLPEGETAAQQTAGYVFDIKLNPEAKWENGDKITADDYVESMKRLLDPKMKNYRANLYYAGESAIAGAAEYYNSESPIYELAINLDTEEIADADQYYINLNAAWALSSSYSITKLYEMGYIYDSQDDPETEEVEETAYGETYYNELLEQKNAYGYVPVTEENQEKVAYVINQFLAAFDESAYNEDGSLGVYYWTLVYYISGIGEKVEYDSVGLYKVDDYTIRYVLKTYQDVNYFYTSLTSTWLVNIELYDAGLDTSGELVTTNYGTSKRTSMSYGVYKIESLQEGKQIVFTQNEEWYGFEKLEDGTLYSETNFLVDGKKVQQYQTNKIVIDVMDEATAKQQFFVGELTDYSPNADELSSFTLSDQLYKVDETYTMSFFFNTNLAMLKTMDESKGNTNSVVLSNTNFRKAFSLAIDRAEFATATAGYKPAYSLMNDLYFYDVYNDPTSKYRATDEAMQAVVNLYGVKYGEGEIYATLEEAYKSISGYNLTEAKALMVTALEELTEAGLYKAGENIHIRIGWAKGALTSDDNAQLALMNKYINAAAKEAGFGEITLEAIGNINDRYGDVPKGEYAIGYGAWGGAAFYPFRNFQVYMDPDQYDLNEAANWDPTTEELTLTVNGEEYTMTYQAWSNSMMGTGQFATADFETKLAITAQLEEIYLKFYYRIPLCATTVCTLLSYQVKYYTEDYNIMYGFGGLRLMTYNYSDAAWADFVEEQGGTLTYN